MSIFDAIKNSVLEGFDTSLTATDILLGLGGALLAGLFILFLYKVVSGRVAFHRGFGLTLLLVTAISAMIVLTITSNLALSLGMVGALSIVRFRTALKEPSDTAFMFWAVAAGITAGAGFYLLTLLGCLLIGAIAMVGLVVMDYSARPYLLVIRAAGDLSAQTEAVLTKSKVKFKLSALVENSDYTEVIYETAFTEKNRGALEKIKALPGITSVSLVDCRKS